MDDYEKTLESVEYTAVLTHYENKILTKIIIVENIYNNSIAIIQLHKGTGKMNIEKRVSEGDAISSKLFEAGIESILRKLI